MNENGKNNEKVFGEAELNSLRNKLPSRYYREFESIWKTFYKGIPAPSRQLVSAVLRGTDNDRVLKVLIEIVRRRESLKEELKEVINA